MFSFRNNRDTDIGSAFITAQQVGTSVPLYISKKDTAINKDRVAASFISDNSLCSSGKFEYTVLNTTVSNNRINIKEGGKFKSYMSNKPLTYNSLMALIYRLRLDGWVITDIANISYKNNESMVSVEGINTLGTAIKISICDDLRDLASFIIEESTNRLAENHYVSTVKLKASTCVSNKKTQCIIMDALNSLKCRREYFEIRDDTGSTNYIIYEYEEFTCLVSGNTITVFAQVRDIKIDEFENTIASYCERIDINYTPTITSAIIMI